MNGTTLLVDKGTIDVDGTSTDNTHIELACGGYIKVQESPVDGLRVLPSGNIQISGHTFAFKR